MVHFQPEFEKYSRARSALGSPPEATPGVSFQHLFENGPYLRPSMFKIAIRLDGMQSNQLENIQFEFVHTPSISFLLTSWIQIPGHRT